MEIGECLLERSARWLRRWVSELSWNFPRTACGEEVERVREAKQEESKLVQRPELGVIHKQREAWKIFPGHM